MERFSLDNLIVGAVLGVICAFLWVVLKAAYRVLRPLLLTALRWLQQFMTGTWE